MDYKLRQLKAQEGIELLEKGIFPNELLEPIKDKRVRVDVANNIFYPKGSPHVNDLSSEQRAERARRLKVELAFVNKMSSLDSLKRIPIILALIGALMLFFTTIHNNGNLPFAIITMVETIVLFAMVLSVKMSDKIINIFALSGLVLLILEFAIFWLPNPVLTNLDNNILESRIGALPKIVNLVSPFLYVGGKVAVFGVLFSIRNRMLTFSKAKAAYEGNVQGKVNI